MLSDQYITEFCSKCGHEQQFNFKFCSKCGQRNPEKLIKEVIKDKDFSVNIKYLATYAIISIILLLIATFGENTIEILVFWTVSFAVIDLIFAYLQPKVWSLFQLNKIDFKPLLYIVIIAFATGIFISYSMDNLNLLLFDETFEYMTLFWDLEYPLITALIMIAVFPALFEEMAFRGFIYNNLEKLAGKKSAIWGSSFLFGLVHFSLLSLIWLIPFGLLLSHFRTKYSTILYGIAGHFVHNATVLLIEYYNLF